MNTSVSLYIAECKFHVDFHLKRPVTNINSKFPYVVGGKD